MSATHRASLRRSKSIIVSNMSNMVIANKQDTTAYGNLEAELTSIEDQIKTYETFEALQAKGEQENLRAIPSQVAPPRPHWLMASAGMTS